MDRINLQSNEAILMEKDNVAHGGLTARYSDKLILTNLNVIYIKKGVMGNVKDIQYFPVKRIKVFDGKAQARITATRNGTPALSIGFLDSQEEFSFMSATKKEICNWVDQISVLVTGNHASSELTNDVKTPMETVASQFQDTISTFKNIFGSSAKQEEKEINKNTVATCPGCGATVSGSPGQIVTCPFCDRKLKL